MHKTILFAGVDKVITSKQWWTLSAIAGNHHGVPYPLIHLVFSLKESVRCLLFLISKHQ